MKRKRPMCPLLFPGMNSKSLKYYQEVWEVKSTLLLQLLRYRALPILIKRLLSRANHLGILSLWFIKIWKPFIALWKQRIQWEEQRLTLHLGTPGSSQVRSKWSFKRRKNWNKAKWNLLFYRLLRLPQTPSWLNMLQKWGVILKKHCRNRLKSEKKYRR